MKPHKVFQRTDKDCSVAAIASYLGIPYSEGPPSIVGLNIDYTVFVNGKKRYYRDIIGSNIDSWLAQKGYWWDNIKGGVYYRPWKFYLGFAVENEMLSHRNQGHVVVMRGPKIWHDPCIDSDITAEDITYSLTIKKRKS